jgi:hypothetical protein
LIVAACARLGGRFRERLVTMVMVRSSFGGNLAAGLSGSLLRLRTRRAAAREEVVVTLYEFVPVVVLRRQRV